MSLTSAPSARAALALLLATVLGCRDAGGPDAFGPGTYELVSVNGEPIPYELPVGAGQPGRIITGATIMVLPADSLETASPRLRIGAPDAPASPDAPSPRVAYELRGGDSLYIVGSAVPGSGSPLEPRAPEYFLARVVGREIRGTFTWNAGDLTDDELYLADFVWVSMVFRRR